MSLGCILLNVARPSKARGDGAFGLSL